MSRLLDDENDLLPQRDRELTLSTGAILGIFLGLILLCAVFFGFGYNLGRKSTVALPTAAAAPPDESAQPETAAPSSGTSSTFDSFKPPPSSAAPASPAAANTVAVPASRVSSPTEAASRPSSPASLPVTHPAAAAPRPPTVVTPKPPAPPPSRSNAAAAPSVPAVPPTGAFVVQVAAVSRKDDADLLVGALRAKGYQVAQRSEPQDKLIHIQVGPFATRKDAEAMRERLVLDGYNAIVK